MHNTNKDNKLEILAQHSVHSQAVEDYSGITIPVTSFKLYRAKCYKTAFKIHNTNKDNELEILVQHSIHSQAVEDGECSKYRLLFALEQIPIHLDVKF